MPGRPKEMPPPPFWDLCAFTGTSITIFLAAGLAAAFFLLLLLPFFGMTKFGM
eukprot:m.314614 g.314614  ORF g.314614 m.314614 type:complete len:53 (+) comp23063_c0_seq12:3706-3864(+)